MNHGSLFSGGGGFDLAAEMMGWQNVFHCENDAFCQRVLKYYWPGSTTHTDVKELDGQKYKGKIDVLTGGFPCQPFSNAGKRRGTEDDRYLWPEMLRVIKEVRPRWVIGENVYGIINWNDGLVFDQVLSDLEAEDYEVWPYVLPAAGVDAPHQRYRVFIVAFNAAHKKASTNEYLKAMEQACSDTYSKGLEGRKNSSWPQKSRTKTNERLTGFYKYRSWTNWPSESPLCGRNDGLPVKLDGITLSKWRTQSVKLFGNAIVPQVALQLYKAIEAYDIPVPQALS